MSASKTILLGVNVDHVATVRAVRGVGYPDAVSLALAAEEGGADGITMHLREDRRHILDDDVVRMAAATATKLNLEMAATDEMRAIALRVAPADVCVVPERRAELTTEGGLDVVRYRDLLRDVVAEFDAADIRTSLFIDPDRRQIDASLEVGAPVVELHTGKYADAESADVEQAELQALIVAAKHADAAGIIVNAGHGLHYDNVKPVAAIAEINELNIGHAIVAHALEVGMSQAVREMKRLMLEGRGGVG